MAAAQQCGLDAITVGVGHVVHERHAREHEARSEEARRAKIEEAVGAHTDRARSCGAGA